MIIFPLFGNDSPFYSVPFYSVCSIMFRLNRWMGFPVSFSRSRPFSSPFGRPNAIRTPRSRPSAHTRTHSAYMRDIGDRTRDNRRADRRVAHSLARSLARAARGFRVCWFARRGLHRASRGNGRAGKKSGKGVERQRERERAREGGKSRERERERETAVERKKRPESGVAQSESSGERTAGRAMGWRERVDGRGRGLEAAG